MGFEVWPCESASASRLQLHAYVLEWWKEEMGTTAIPSDRDEAIEAYFRKQKLKKPPHVPEHHTLYLRDLVTKDSLRPTKAKEPKKTTRVPGVGPKAWKRKGKAGGEV